MARGKYEEWLMDDSLFLLEGWARDGLTDKQIAHNCGISLSTLKEWKSKHPAISAALKKGKQIIDLEVVGSLLKSAMGYDYEEVTTERDAHGNVFSMKTVRKHQPAVTAAQIFWLKNRLRDQWKDNHDKAELDKERLELDRERLIADKAQDGTENAVHVTFSIEEGEATIEEALG